MRGAAEGREAWGAGAVARRPSSVLAALFLADAALVAVHVASVAAGLGGFIGWQLRVTTEGGPAEVWGYAQALGAAGLLWSMRSHAAALSWVPAVLFLVTDDALALHEAAGAALSEAWAHPYAQEVGEVALLAGAGLVLVVPVALAYLNAGPVGRRLSRDVAALLALFAFFAGGVDVLHAVVGNEDAFGHALGVVEDGGELVALSCLAARLWWWRLRLA